MPSMLERLRYFVRYGKAAGAFGRERPAEKAGGDSPIPLTRPPVTEPVVAAATATPTFSETPYAAESAEELGRDAIAQDDAARSTGRYTREAELLVAHEREEARRRDNVRYPGLDSRYEISEAIGHGTFSQVVRARDTVSGEDVAIKIVSKYGLRHRSDRLDPNFREKADAVDRDTVLREVQIMRRVEHPTIVRLIDFCESNEYFFLIMELLDGGELFEQIVHLTYFSEPLARHVILQVAHAIRHLHETCGVVHRDIKPENLLFERISIVPSENVDMRPHDEDKRDEGVFQPGRGGGGIGRVKLADFGLSKVVWERSTKTPCGTVGYTAPEIVNDEHYSKAVDMWALGCVLYTLLCGFPPFYDESIQVLTEKVSRGEYSFVSPWWDDVSDSAKNVVEHLLCIDPDKRYTIKQFLEHEWCKGADSSSQEPRSALAGTPFAEGNIPRMGNDAGRLREAFDVTYAVHRIAEQDAIQHSSRRGAHPSTPHKFELHLDDSTLLARRRAITNVR